MLGACVVAVALMQLGGSLAATQTAAAGQAGLVAAYGLDEGSGTTVTDQSGNGNNGTIANATWVAGKYGNALSFNGSNSWVTVADSNSLDLTTGMTVEAWVNPSALGAAYRTVVFKEQTGNEVFSLYGAQSGSGQVPTGEAFIGGYKNASGTSALALNSWTHLAESYDGSSLRLYVNGTLVATTAAPGALTVSNGALRIGGNNIWGEYFAGLIDEVRVYNRALSAAEIQTDMATPITPIDTQPPTAPANLSATGALSSASLSWSASSDNVGVTRYDLYRSTTSGFTPSTANRIAQPSGTSYTDSSLSAGTYYYKVAAEDAAGNLSAASTEASAIVGDTSPPTAPGTLSATGAVGKATLSWGAASDNVGVTRYDLYRSTTSGFTPSTANRIAQPSGTSYVDLTTPGTYYYKVAAEDAAGNLGPASNEASATVSADTTPPSTPANPAASVTGGSVNLSWSASSDDVGVTRYDLYRSTSSGFTPSTANRIAQPGGTSYVDSGLAIGTYYYKVVAEDAAGNLSTPSSEVSASVADSTPPSAPTSLAASVLGANVSLSWNPSNDNIGVLRYDLYRGTSAGFAASAANRIAQPTGTAYSDNGLAAGSYYYKVAAEDAAGNLSPVSNEVVATIPDTTAPTAPTNLTASGSAGQTSLFWLPSSDNVGVTRYDLYRSTSSGFTPSAANRIAQPTGLSYTDNGLAAGTYYYKVAAEDAAGNLSAASNQATAVVTAAVPAGLVAALGFDEGTGTGTADRSGNGNNGTIANATWVAGKYGNALSFNGSNSWVTVADSNSLDLTTGMTVEAWVNPSALGAAYRTVVFKEQTGNEVFSLYGAQSGSGQVPTGEAFIGGYKNASGTSALALNSWTHLAESYDGSSLRLYVNGTLVATTAAPGALTVSNGALRIGGNNIWGEYFAGLIDEVRVYNRALSAAEIQTDMATPITPIDTQPPTAPANLSATGALSSASLSWSASSDNVGVTRYDLYRSTTSGFTPSTANRIAQPSGTSYTDSSLSAGTYYYKVAAEDAAGNLSAASNEASAIVGDTSPPTAPGTLSATGAVGKATLSWGAASDNVGVTRYDLYRSTSSGFTPSTANRIAQPSGTSYVDLTTPGTYYYKVAAEDAAGNLGPASNEASATVSADTTPPSTPANPAASVTGGSVNLSWSASSDDVGVTRYDLYRSTSSGFTPSTANRIAQPGGTSYVDSGLAIGTYYYKVVAEDAAGNLSTPSSEVSASVADSTPPSAPTSLAASVLGANVSLSWNPSNDNIGVLRYDLYRGTSAGFAASAANRIAQPTGTAYSDNGLAAGSYYYKVAAEDAAGNLSPVSNEVVATIPDTTAPTAPTNLTASGSAGQTSLFWLPSSDNVGVTRYDLYRSTSSGFTPSAANRIAQPTGLSYTDNGLAAGTYYYKVAAEDAAGNLSAASNQATAVVTMATRAGLVAAYGFDAGSGTTAIDQSGNGNNGTIANATWVAGKFGNGLFFNGSNARVNINDSNSLDLTTGMTLEAWVKPSLLNAYQTAIFKEQTGDLAYGLYANTTDNAPDTEAYIGGVAKKAVAGSALATGAWSYLTATYDGTSLHLYLNGVQTAQVAASGSILTSAGALRIGGNNIWNEWFNGWIDEVRVYNRALSAAEIQDDMNISVTPDTTLPTIVAKSPADGSAGINVGTPVAATFSELIRSSSLTASSFVLKDSAGNVVPASVSFDTSTNVATLAPQVALQYGATYTATVKGGSGRCHGLRRQSARLRRQLVVHDRGLAAAAAGRDLERQPLRDVPDRDPAQRGPRCLHHPRSLAAGTGGALQLRRRPARRYQPERKPGDDLEQLGQRWRQADRDAPGQAAGRPARAERCRLDPCQRLPQGQHRKRPRGRDHRPDDPVPRQRRPLHPQRRERGRNALLECDDGYQQPGGQPALGRRKRRPGGRLQLRPGPLGRPHPPGQPGLGRAGARRRPRRAPGRHVLRGQERRCPARLARHEQDRDPAGRRAAAPAHQPDHPDGAQQAAAAPLLVPAARAEGGRRDERRRSRRRRHRLPLRPVQGGERARLCGRPLAVRPLDLLHLPGQPAHQRPGRRLHRRRLRGRAPPSDGGCNATPRTPAYWSALFDSQLLQFTAKYTSVPAQVSSRTHCVEWPDWASEAKIELAHGIRLDGNYYHFSSGWIGNKPGFLTGGGFPMRFADSDGSLIDVYQENTNMDDEAGQLYPATVNALLDNATGPNGYYGVLAPTCTPTRQATSRTRMRSSPRPRLTACRSSPTSSFDLRSTAQQLDHPRPLLERRHLHLCHHRRRGWTGLQTMLPTQGPSGSLSALSCGARRGPTRCRRSRESSTRCSTRSPAAARRRTPEAFVRPGYQLCAGDQGTLQNA